MQTTLKTRNISILIVFFLLLSTAAAWCAPGAILISGLNRSPQLPVGRGDIKRMETALTDTTVGAGISSTNILKKEQATQSDLNQLISQANSAGYDPLYIHISAHGDEGVLALANGNVTSTTLAISIAQSTASTAFISIAA